MIVGAFDVHRRQITFDWVDRVTGEARRGQIAPATREGCEGGWASCLRVAAMSRWRGAPAGGLWPRNSRRPG
jgi:transposase